MSTGATAASAPRSTSLKVGLGQMVVSSEPGDVLAALGLGSCIGLTAFDPVSKVAGMVHVMLPESEIATRPGPEGKYADTAIPALVTAMRKLGADPTRLVCKMAGGAQMFGGGSGGGSLNIGSRNAIAVRAALQSAGLRLKSAQTGGNFGRTVELHVGSGLVTVRSVGGPSQEL
ncbi:MAG: chemotaxis protein CheD [Thermoleophilia bacterium]